MSPTSYQTAPPRDTERIIGFLSGRVKLIINKINSLAKPLILLNLSLKRRLLNGFVPLNWVYHRFTTDSEGPSEDLGAAINLFTIGVNIDIAGGRDVGMAELFLAQFQTSRCLMDYGGSNVSESMTPRGAFGKTRPASTWLGTMAY